LQARKERTRDTDRQRKTERDTQTEVLSSRALRDLIFERGEKSDACEMACEAEKKLGPSCYELYGGMMFGGGKVHGSVAGKIDRFQGWSRFNAASLGETHCIGSSYNAAAKDDKQQKKLHGNVVPGSSVVEELGTDNTSAASIKSFRSSSCSSSSYLSGKATAAAAATTAEMNKGGSSSSTISSKIQNSSSSSLGHRRGGTCDMGSLQNHKGFATASAGEASSSGSESGRSSAGSDSGRYFSTAAAAHPRKTTPRILQAPPVPAAPVPVGEEDQWQGAPHWNEGAAAAGNSFFTQGGEQQQAPSCHKEVPVRQRQPWQQLGVQAVAP
jgi:hypothetical protein